MAKQLQLELSNDDRGFFRTVGFHQNEQGRRVPRKFRLGHDRQQAFLKLQALLDAWDEIPGDRGSKVWTDAAIQAALDSVPINQQASRSEISTDARMPRATAVDPHRLARRDAANAFDLWQDDRFPRRRTLGVVDYDTTLGIAATIGWTLCQPKLRIPASRPGSAYRKIATRSWHPWITGSRRPLPASSWPSMTSC